MANDSEKNNNIQKYEEYFQLSIEEVSTIFGVDSVTIIKIVNEGIINVKQDEQGQLNFDDEAVRLIRIVLNLNRDLGVNFAGAGLVLELMKEIEHLESLIKEH